MSGVPGPSVEPADQDNVVLETVLPIIHTLQFDDQTKTGRETVYVSLLAACALGQAVRVTVGQNLQSHYKRVTGIDSNEKSSKQQGINASDNNGVFLVVSEVIAPPRTE